MSDTVIIGGKKPMTAPAEPGIREKENQMHNTVTFLADVIRETEKAIQIALPGVSRKYWLPKSISTVAERENEFSKEPETIITIPAWKARDFGGAMLMI